MMIFIKNLRYILFDCKFSRQQKMESEEVISNPIIEIKEEKLEPDPDPDESKDPFILLSSLKVEIEEFGEDYVSFLFCFYYVNFR